MLFNGPKSPESTQEGQRAIHARWYRISTLASNTISGAQVKYSYLPQEQLVPIPSTFNQSNTAANVLGEKVISSAAAQEYQIESAEEQRLAEIRQRLADEHGRQEAVNYETTA
ncbi:MAG: hypothetical protein WA843_03415 [Candidatus Saccharimonadales bacterium]